MNEREPPAPEPQRLLYDRELGKLISQANGVYRGRLDESGAFQRLSERLERPRRSWRWQGLTLGAVLSAAAGVVMVLGGFEHALFDRALFQPAPSRVALGPELSTSRRALREGREPAAPTLESEAPSAPADAPRASADDAVGTVDNQPPAAGRVPGLTDPDHRDVRAAVPPRSAVPPAGERQVARSDASPRSEPRPPSGEAEAQVVAAPQRAVPPGPARADDGIEPASDGKGAAPGMAGNSMASAGEAPSSASRAIEARLDCSDLVEKDARAAEHCYAQRAAESSGLSAEVALYELARLRRDVQQDAKGALAALSEYRERFPRGSLRNEVGLTRVELLSELGRSREALNEGEALLGSAQGGERAAELHLLRGDIFRRDLADFAQAAQEYSKAEKFGGGFGAEATRLRGLSLEALGDVAGALAAYRRYLSGPEQPRKGEVHRRVEALTSSQRGATP